MGDRVLIQIVAKDGEFSPIIYGHWAGSTAKAAIARLKKRMKDRLNDVSYSAARMVQELINDDEADTGFGLMHADKILTADDSQGDAGVILVDARTFKCTYLGGYLK